MSITPIQQTNSIQSHSDSHSIYMDHNMAKIEKKLNTIGYIP